MNDSTLHFWNFICASRKQYFRDLSFFEKKLVIENGNLLWETDKVPQQKFYSQTLQTKSFQSMVLML